MSTHSDFKEHFSEWYLPLVLHFELFSIRESATSSLQHTCTSPLPSQRLKPLSERLHLACMTCQKARMITSALMQVKHPLEACCAALAAAVLMARAGEADTAHLHVQLDLTSQEAMCASS
jgi:hypothetical protein